MAHRPMSEECFGPAMVVTVQSGAVLMRLEKRSEITSRDLFLRAVLTILPRTFMATNIKWVITGKPFIRLLCRGKAIQFPAHGTRFLTVA